jgi:hypothetical protein
MLPPNNTTRCRFASHAIAADHLGAGPESSCRVQVLPSYVHVSVDVLSPPPKSTITPRAASYAMR